MADNTEVKDLENAGEAEAGEEKGNEEGGEQQAQSHEEEFTPPVRRSAASFIIERKNRTIEKLREKADEGFDEESEKEDIDARIARALDERLNPVLSSVKSTADDFELRDYLSNNPEMRKYEAKARKMLSHPAYSAAAPEVVFKYLASQDIVSESADKAVSQANKIRKQSIKANSQRKQGSGNEALDFLTSDEFKNMSPEEFRKYQASIRGKKVELQ